LVKEKKMDLTQLKESISKNADILELKNNIKEVLPKIKTSEEYYLEILKKMKQELITNKYDSFVINYDKIFTETMAIDIIKELLLEDFGTSITAESVGSGLQISLVKLNI